MTGATSTRPAGRPRDPDLDVAILTATIAVLSRDGYGGLSVDRIAAAAGVSKATIYRRWASKKDVVVAAAEHLSQSVPIPDTGDVGRDLEMIVAELTHVFGQPATVGLVAALVAGMADDAELAGAVRTGFLLARREGARTVLERARARGEIRGDVDLDVAIDLLAAPFYYRLLITGHAIDHRFAVHVVEGLLAWIRPAP